MHYRLVVHFIKTQSYEMHGSYFFSKRLDKCELDLQVRLEMPIRFSTRESSHDVRTTFDNTFRHIVCGRRLWTGRDIASMQSFRHSVRPLQMT
jgi:hypothetical protein